MSRYKLIDGDYGNRFHDTREDHYLRLVEVLALLNAADDKVFDVRNEAVKADGEQVLEIRRLTRELGERTDERDKVRDLEHEVSKLKSERDEARLYEQQAHDRAIKALSDVGIESKGVGMGIDELAEERDDLVRARDAARKALDAADVGADNIAEAINVLAAERNATRTHERRACVQLADVYEVLEAAGVDDDSTLSIAQHVSKLVDEGGGREQGQRAANEALDAAGVSGPRPVADRIVTLAAERDDYKGAYDLLDGDMQKANRAFEDAGVGAQDLTLAERIAILAQRSRSSAYVAGLERAAARVLDAWHGPDSTKGKLDTVSAMDALYEATRDRADKPTGIVTKAFHEAAIKTREAEIEVLKNAEHTDNGRADDERRRRVYYQNIVYAVCRLIDPGEHKIVCGTVDEPSTQVQDCVRGLVERGDRASDEVDGESRRRIEDLQTRNRHLTNKLALIVEIIPPGDVYRAVIEDIVEPMSPNDPAAVEIERAVMLAEIDDLLRAHGAWAGGRLDSIKTLLGQRDGMRNLLLTIHRFIDDNRAAINSWVVTTVEER